ncbi:arylacetamide deacetylase [Colletotrichum asianum]
MQERTPMMQRYYGPGVDPAVLAAAVYLGTLHQCVDQVLDIRCKHFLGSSPGNGDSDARRSDCWLSPSDGAESSPFSLNALASFMWPSSSSSVNIRVPPAESPAMTTFFGSPAMESTCLYPLKVSYTCVGYFSSGTSVYSSAKMAGFW